MSYRRYRRSGPGRTGPAQNDRAMYGSSGDPSGCSGPGWPVPPWWMGGGAPFASAAGFVSDAVDEGTRLSCDMLQEQMRLSQQLCRQWTCGFPPSPDTILGIIERTVDFYANVSIDWATFWVQLLFPTYAPGWPVLPPCIGGPVQVNVTPPRRGRASCQLWPGAELFSLQVLHDLWSRDPMKPPLANVEFRMENDQNVLYVNIPGNQPPDLYLGVICNQRSGEPVGTVAVQVWGD